MGHAGAYIHTQTYKNLYMHDQHFFQGITEFAKTYKNVSAQRDLRKENDKKKIKHLLNIH